MQNDTLKLDYYSRVLRIRSCIRILTGHLFSLAAGDSSIVWENPCKDLGCSTYIFASENQNTSVISGQTARQQALSAETDAVISTSSSSTDTTSKK